jgi:hypothetical protein
VLVSDLKPEWEAEIRARARPYPRGGAWTPITKYDLQALLTEIDRLRTEVEELEALLTKAERKR